MAERWREKSMNVRRIVRGAAVLALVTGLLANVAAANAKYVSSTPAAGSTAATAPANVVITFSEDLAPGTTARIQAPSGGVAVGLGGTIDSSKRILTVPLNAGQPNTVVFKDGLPNGEYGVAWHSVSAVDGNPDNGTFFFTIAAPAPSSATAASPTAPAIASVPVPTASPTSDPAGSLPAGMPAIAIAIGAAIVILALAALALARRRR